MICIEFEKGSDDRQAGRCRKILPQGALHRFGYSYSSSPQFNRVLFYWMNSV